MMQKWADFIDKLAAKHAAKIAQEKTTIEPNLFFLER
jgi:hypothetical protein